MCKKKNGVETTLKPKGYRFDNVNYHSTNILNAKMLEGGLINSTNGELTDNETACRTQSYIAVVPLTKYNISNLARDIVVHFYNDKKQWVSSVTCRSNFNVPGDCYYIRIVANVPVDQFTEYSSVVVAADNLYNTIIIEDLNYVLLSAITGGEIIGLVQCVDKFINYADLTYLTYYKQLKDAQDAIDANKNIMATTVGDLLREGWWHDVSYIDGDETKLRDDALSNLKQISKPDATYIIAYLDPYRSNLDNKDFGATEDTVEVYWPDLSITSAAHLVDPDIDINH